MVAMKLKRKVWEFLRPQLREIFYTILGTVLGFGLGLWSSFFFESRQDRLKALDLLRSAASDVQLALTPSWYPMYYDSVKFAGVGTPFPQVENTSIAQLSTNLPFVMVQIQREVNPDSLRAVVLEAQMEIQEFNLRINLRNMSIIQNTFAADHNAHAYQYFQASLVPSLKRLKVSIEKALN
jgi:hypothetical protein